MSIKTATEVDKQVGARIKARRQAIRMSQSALAEAVGITFQQVQKYEKGTNRIGASRLAQIATTLDVPVFYFFDGLDGTGEASSVLADPQVAELLSAFRAIENEDLRRAIVGVVQLASGAPGAAKETGSGAGVPGRRRGRSNTIVP